MNDYRPLTILLVDDDEDDLLLAQRALDKSDLPHKAYSVHNGVELLEYLNRSGGYTEKTAPLPDLILLDLNMPKKNGIEALTEIRADAALRHIPIVLFTTSNSEQDILHCYQLGANSYIKKPVSFDALVEVMGSLKDYWVQYVILPPHRIASR